MRQPSSALMRQLSPARAHVRQNTSGCANHRARQRAREPHRSTPHESVPHIALRPMNQYRTSHYAP
eukprot:2766559-Rhodomonas_salina.1